MNSWIDAHNVSKSFDDRKILDEVDFSLAPSEIVAITGKSGAGKSTLLHILSTLDNADKGSIALLGIQLEAATKNDFYSLRNQSIGFIFQFHHLIAEFTAMENIMLPLLIGGTIRSEANHRAQQALTFVGLGHRINAMPKELSGGEQQRVAIARAIVHRPKIVFADEPTGNLDTENSNQIFDLFSSIRKEFGTSFVIVTHDIHFAQKCDRVVQMLDGKII